ncbi:pyridoxamine 5'-phosphate oxidase family protein [Jatrophihabitans telluris]|uniref:Pyridoxamine 5'-phosphate oxidase family protein n=1 Tax=Jatrophihabitans telluris TaxID=2038343 RepID=A0ABY4QWA8_9ACTN|nr:pyridoxamine 5'-phosphate oxidase family protein [Jatrophihabitans telluris]UQX87542.1 pyridoxamine 5'-phosphate oxidase family protein [Jatrophihabitans telluris]
MAAVPPEQPAPSAPSEPTVEIHSEAELTEILGIALPAAANKVRPALHDLDRQWLAASPFCLVATSDAHGHCDVSPKGDPAGFALVLDETTLAIAERPGNRRADGFRNVLANPHVGLIFLVPGRTDTLRVNGRARLVRQAPFFDRMTVRGHRPALALVVDVEEVFYHCSKAFLRSKLWDPQAWHPEQVPDRADIVHTVERPHEDLAAIREHYGPSYAENLY